jgi:hypothetical protein
MPLMGWGYLRRRKEMLRDAGMEHRGFFIIFSHLPAHTVFTFTNSFLTPTYYSIAILPCSPHSFHDHRTQYRQYVTTTLSRNSVEGSMHTTLLTSLPAPIPQHILRGYEIRVMINRRNQCLRSQRASTSHSRFTVMT